jgi:acyl-CoA thioesterase I
MRVRTKLAVPLLVLAAACSGSPSDATPSDELATIVSTSRRAEFVAAGSDLAVHPGVLIRDRDLRPLSGRSVRFMVAPDSGAAAEFVVQSDSTGRASLPAYGFPNSGHYRIDARFGSTNLVQFTVVALPETLLTPAAITRCPLLDDTLPQFGGIARTVTLLREKRPVTIVALGSSSTFGTGASDTSLSFPSQFARELQRVFPASAIRLFNAGIGGNVATDLDARLERDVLVHTPDLVILQTGTNDARTAVPLDTMRAATRRTITRIRERSADIVLLDSQRFQGDGESPLFLTYLAAVTDVATSLNVPVARRYAWMSAVLAARTYTYDDLIGPDHLHQTDLASECTAHILSTGITAAAYGGTR